MQAGIGLGVGKLVLKTGAAVVGGLQLQLIQTRELFWSDAGATGQAGAQVVAEGGTGDAAAGGAGGAGWQARQDRRQFAGIEGVIEAGPALVVLVDHEQGIGKFQTVFRGYAGGGVVVEEVAIHQGDRIATGLGRIGEVVLAIRKGEEVLPIEQ